MRTSRQANVWTCALAPSDAFILRRARGMPAIRRWTGLQNAIEVRVHEDLSVQWTLANLLAVQIDDRRDAWNAGAARDVAALDFDRILVAADTGGIWMLNRNGDALPVADVDYPDFWCISAGLYGNDHLYGGGQKL